MSLILYIKTWIFVFSSIVCALPDDALGPQNPGCVRQWFVDAGCTPNGTLYPAGSTSVWTNLTAGNVRAQFSALYVIASAGSIDAINSCLGVNGSVFVSRREPRHLI